MAQTCLATTLAHGLPQDVRKKADENMCLNPLLFLVPDGTDLQIGLMDTERKPVDRHVRSVERESSVSRREP